MALTDEEKTKVRYHLGWHITTQNVINASGLPLSVPAELLVEHNMNKLDEHGDKRVREILCQLDKLEGLKKTAPEDMLVAKAGDVTFRADYPDLLDKQYADWQAKLGDALGTSPHIFSKGNERVGTAPGGFVERWSNRRA